MILVTADSERDAENKALACFTFRMQPPVAWERVDLEKGTTWFSDADGRQIWLEDSAELLPGDTPDSWDASTQLHIDAREVQHPFIRKNQRREAIDAAFDKAFNATPEGRAIKRQTIEGIEKIAERLRENPPPPPTKPKAN